MQRHHQYGFTSRRVAALTVAVVLWEAVLPYRGGWVAALGVLVAALVGWRAGLSNRIVRNRSNGR